MSLPARETNVSGDLNDSFENACVVCFKNVEIFSIGECDHPVCFECSTRMRVLCQQNECPICRQGLSKVIFTTEKRPYRELEASNRSEYYNKKYKICFATLNIQKAFYQLLDHPCPKCVCPPFRSFDELKDHVRKHHEMFFCDICTDNLKIFSCERKCYNRQELALHRRKGDPDNTSHRGHPLCKYCDERYVDRDELFRHLRREHYYCHFCDADGANQFYSDGESLREHFRNEHYLCEEGVCARELFTVVFRSDIDLRAHISNVHGRTLGKLQAKQARTLQLDITIGPRGRSAQSEQAIANLRSRNNEEVYEVEQIGTVTPIMQNSSNFINAQNEQEFPSLRGTGNSATSVTLIRPAMSIRAKAYGTAGLARTKENFPALGGGGGGTFDGAVMSRPNQAPANAVLKNSSSLPKGNSGGSMVIHVSNRPNVASSNSSSLSTGPKKPLPYQHDFPALPGTTKGQSHLREDFIPPDPISMNSVAAKHRSLVDDYVSSVKSQSSTKITLVQKDNAKTGRKDQIKNTPKLTENDFPALSERVNTAPEASWVRGQKQQDAENRKSKVAPAPILNGFENLNKKVHERREQVKNMKSISDADNNNQMKKDKKQIKNNEKKDNEGKHKAENSAKINLKQTNKPKEKKIDNNNEQKNGNKNKDHLGNSSELNCADLHELPTSGPPPGFNARGNPGKAPPGFHNVTLNSVAKPKNNLTFTSSLGESYSILPTHVFLPPPNSANRNQELVTHFQNTLKHPEAVAQFRQISKMFREGEYKARAYYEHCQAALQDKFDEIFPELLALLPDISKQQELYLVHSQQMKEMGNKSYQKQRTRMEVCGTCKQVLKASDVKAHAKNHNLDSNFPALQAVDNLISTKVKK